MKRRVFIEMLRRQIYGGQPSDDAEITVGLVNAWINPAIAIATKQNYKDNITIGGIGYVNNSFYTTYKGITPSSDETFKWKIRLPEVPTGIGYNEGVSVLTFKSDKGEISLPCIPLTENQRTYFETARPVQGKILYYYEGEYIYVKSTLLLNQYTASVTMISGGDSSDLDSTLNIPSDYLPVMIEYIQKQLLTQRNMVVDTANDGLDAIKTT